MPEVQAHAGSCSQDLRILEGENPVRGLALYVLPVGSDASDEVLDLLGETPLVTDASGTVHLRRFVPGEYEVRVDLGRSSNATAMHSLRSRNLILKEGEQEPFDWPFGSDDSGENR